MVTLPWALAAQARTDGEYLREALGVHVIERSLRPFEGHGFEGALGWLAGLPFYVVVLPLIALPWSLVGMLGLWKRWRSGQRGLDVAFLVGWVVGPLAVLSLVATKMPHYGLAVVPALTLSGGLWVAGAIAAGASTENDSARARRLLALAYAIACVGLLGAAWLLLRTALARQLLGEAGIRGSTAAVGVCLICLVVGGVGSTLVRRRVAWVRLLAAATLVFELAVAAIGLPAVGRVVVWEAVAQDVRELDDSDATVLVVGDPEPGLVYALGALPRVVDGASALEAIVEPGSSSVGRFVVVADLRSIEPALARALRERPGVRIRREVAIAKGASVEIAVVVVE